MPTTSRKPFWRSRWWLPALALFLGVLILAASWIGDNPDDGVIGLIVMAVVAAIFFFGGRSDTLAGLGGPGRDERWAMIDLRATFVAGTVLIACIIGAWLYELTQGRDGEPYTQLSAVAGLTYVVAVAVLRWRG